MKKILPYLQLFRIPNVFTAMADVTLGYLFVYPDLNPPAMFACLLVASSLLYIAGMVLNDVYDFQQDAEERPHRPLPSGRIGRSWAWWLGYEMLLVGVALAALAGFLYPNLPALPWRSGAVAVMLAICVVAYDAGVKRTWFGPVFMGACRFFNLLLGMSLASAALGPWSLLRFESAELLVAAGIGVYIAGVTWFARSEARESSRLQLGSGLAVMLAGIGIVALLPVVDPSKMIIQSGLWHLLLLVLGVTIGWRCSLAVSDPRPERIQPAVKNAILSLIIIDAAVCMAVAGPLWAIGILTLLMPTMFLGKWVYST